MAAESHDGGSGVRRAFRAVWRRLVAALMTIGSSLGSGSRSGDPQARDLYERRNRDYRP
ncbi:hypothetical protein [Leifsonia sp. SIMBA_070]|uniref:hypothetical protein n=1 Tax=Leifsonia sp. SIMBA_070 TaxID=3085810 RepID=UPI0039796696